MYLVESFCLYCVLILEGPLLEVSLYYSFLKYTHFYHMPLVKYTNNDSNFVVIHIIDVICALLYEHISCFITYRSVD